MKTVRNLCQILCILVAMLAFTNCQTDTDTVLAEEQAMQKAFPYTKSVLTQQEVAANTKLSNQLRGLATMQQQFTENNMYDFTVHTERVHYIESTENNTHSYTFPVSRTNNSGTALENMVFSYNASTEDYTATLVTYHFNALQQQEFFTTQHVGTPYEISSETIAMNIADVLGESNTITPCTTTYTVYHITPDTGDTFLYSIDGAVQNTCEHEQDDDPCDTYTVIEVNCPDGGSSGSTTDDPQNPSSPTSGSTSGGSGTTNDGNTTPDEPNDETPNVVTSPISKEDRQRITEELNEVLGEGNWEFGNNANHEDAPSFDNQEDLQDYIDSLPTSANATETSSEELQSGNMMTRFSFPTAEFLNTADIKVEVVSNLENPVTEQDFEVVGINSQLAGFSLMMAWEANSNFAVVESPISSDFKRINMTGTIKRGIFYEGIDISVDTQCLITMEINKYDGADGYSKIFYINN
ncbi:hypothetical protein KAOT1_03807 [Kordia algicida OT-1]|uniref:Uncharacterized protein n=2 Tax=Kordia TaxID=221065 RepID=A9DW34_9FLAO|nr:hypothetical protein KAOT1_03807 [Kordia algicida OT-1]